MDEARFIKEKAYIPIEGDLDIDQIIWGYEKFFEDTKEKRHEGNITEFEDMVWICGWTKMPEKIEYALKITYFIPLCLFNGLITSSQSFIITFLSSFV